MRAPRGSALLVLLSVGAVAASWLLRLPCRQLGWGGELPAGGMCFSDPPTLFATAGMAAGRYPYLAPDALLEYPLLQTLIASGTGLVTGLLAPVTSVHVGQSIYFDVNAVLLAGVWAVTVLVAARMLPSTRHAAVLAAAPAVIATGLINWDLWTVLTVVAALRAMRGRRWVLAGVLLGLGTALKLWPFIVLGALIVLAIRRRQAGPAVRALLAAVLTWLVLNVPFALVDPQQWGYFWGFSAQRGAGFSSIWQVWNLVAAPVLGVPPLSGEAVNLLAYGGFALCCLAILVWGLAARREPSIELLALLIVAAFVLTNKVYSPQFALWLTPLALLALPRIRVFLVWQGIEVLHWIGVFTWLHAVSWNEPAVPAATLLYVLAVTAHVIAVVVLCARAIAASDEDPRPGPAPGIVASDRAVRS